MWWNIKRNSPEVHLPIIVQAWDDKKDAWPLGPSWPQPAQPEDDSSLILLDYLHIRTNSYAWNISKPGKMTHRAMTEYLDDGADGERKSDEDEKAEEKGQDQSTATRRVRSS